MPSPRLRQFALLLALVVGAQPFRAATSTQAAEAPPALRVPVASDEHFVLELRMPNDGARPTSAAKPVGVARWVRRASDGRVQLELEVRFFDEQLRVHQIETFGPKGSELVWREWRPGHGRTLHVQLEGGFARLVEWGGLEAVRERWSAPVDLVFPLQLVELSRAGAAPQTWGERGPVRFDPLGRACERVRVVANSTDASASLALLREDGSSAGAFAFESGALASFAWQAGELRGRAVDAQEYAELLAQGDSAR